MKKWLAFLIAAVALFIFCACSSAPPSISAASAPAPVVSGNETMPAGAGIALITSVERLESPFGQGVWNSVSRFSGEFAIPAASYKTEKNSVENALATLELAVTGGARVVVAMDAAVSIPLQEVQGQYPDVDFILLDADPALPLAKNSASIGFSEEQAGWLAGYILVSGGRTTLGYASLPDTASQRYVLGFLLGADAAAAEQDLPPLSVTMLTLVVEEAPEPQLLDEQINLLFQAGAGAVFAASTSLQQPVIDAARTAGVPMVGLLLGNLPPSSPVLASIEHDAKNLVYTLLTRWNNHKLPGGAETVGGVPEGDVTLVLNPASSLPADEEQLKIALKRFEDGRVASLLTRLIKPDAEGQLPRQEQLVLEHLVLVEPRAAIEQLAASSLPLPGDESEQPASQPAASNATQGLLL